MNLLLIINADLSTSEPWYLARAAAEFGNLYVVAVAQQGVKAQPSSFSLIQPDLPEQRLRYPNASFFQFVGGSMIDCVQLALTTPNWLPSMDLVLFGGSHGICVGADTWQSYQTQSALLAHGLGVPAFSFFQVAGNPQQRDTVTYVIERLLRAMLHLPRLPNVVLHVNIPNVRPNECEGFTIVKAGASPQRASLLNCNSTPWTFDFIENQNDIPLVGTDHWAVEQKQVAITPLWGWKLGDLAEQIETMSIISTTVAQMGSARPYRSAIERMLNRDVKYNYHFKGAVLSAQPGFCVEHSATPFAFDVDPVIEKPILEHVSGRVLDVGCGQGRIAVYLMTARREHVTEVVGVDSNPASLRDYEKRWTQEVSAPYMTRCLDVRADNFESLGMFDSILLLGSTLGIPGNQSELTRLFRVLRARMRSGGKLVASGRDPEKMTNSEDCLINNDNVKAALGRGERYLRISFENHDTGWFALYYAGLDELRGIANATGWRMLDEYTCWQNPDQYGVVFEAA